jgi:hypothetical protein
MDDDEQRAVEPAAPSDRQNYFLGLVATVFNRRSDPR